MTKISALPSASAINDSDTLVVVQSGTTKKALVSLLGTGGGGSDIASLPTASAVNAGDSVAILQSGVQKKALVGLFPPDDIAALPAASVVNGADTIEILQSGVSKKALVSLLLAGGGGGGGGATDDGLHAVPGGATDVTAALQANINAAQTAYPVPLIIPPGLYTISPNGAACLYITGPINIIASPGAHILLKSGITIGNLEMISIKGDHVTIDGGTWDGNILNTSSSGVLYVMKASETDLGGGSYAWHHHFTLRNAHVLNAFTTPGLGVGLDIGNYSYAWVEDNYFEHHNAGLVSYRVFGETANFVFFRNNFLDGVDTIYEPLNIVALAGGTGPTLYYCEVTGNTLIGPPAGPLSCSLQVWQNNSVEPLGNMHHFTIANNISIGSGIGLSVTGLEDSTITGNTVLGAHLGIENGSCVNCAFTGNSINGMGVGNYGLGVDGVGQGTTMNDNTVTNMAAAFDMILSNHNRMTFNGNNLYQPYGSPAGTGILCYSYEPPVTQVGYMTINDNVISLGGSSYPIILDDCSNVVSKGNVIDVETPFVASYTLGEFWASVQKDHIYISDNIMPQSQPAVAITGNYGTDIRVENYNANGSTTKWSSGWHGNLTGSVAPGTSTQATSKSTALASGTPSLNIYALDITMNNAALAAGAVASFVWANTLILATDMVDVSYLSGGTPGAYAFNARCGAGSVTIDVTNISTASKSEAIVIRAAIRRNL